MSSKSNNQLSSSQSSERASSSLPSPSTEKAVQCPICFTTLKDSFITPCQHTFCYECISKHLETKSSCPSCKSYLVMGLLKPNYEVDEAVKVYEERRKRTRSHSYSASTDLQHWISKVDNLSAEELAALIEDLKNKKEQREKAEKREDQFLLFEFLQQAISKKEATVRRLQDELQVLVQSKQQLESEYPLLQQNKESLLEEHMQSSSSLHMNRRQRIMEHFDYLEERLYTLHQCSESHNNIGAALDQFREDLYKFSKYAGLQCKAILKHAEIPNISNIISSIEFDRDSEYIATAGVTKRIRIFEFGNVLESVLDTHYPVKEMVSPTKLSCLSWNSYIHNHLLSSDYEGVVTLWDAITGQTLNEFEEHEKRIWSVDFSKVEPTKFASASDDGKVKIWSSLQLHSVSTIENRANVCCVQFHPTLEHLISFGCADHQVYMYDLRQTKQALHILRGHRKAVSYIKFFDDFHLVSASTDNTLKLWNISQSSVQRTFQGHQNEKNFVGLSTSEEYIACGSENNAVYVYYKEMGIPMLSYR
jgi:E3 ubiquitin-protein ligase RFWD2